jgi:hypothetical protein
MTVRLTVTARYPRDPDAVFAEALDIGGMVRASRRMARYSGPGVGAFEEGGVYDFDVTIWGVIRNRGHRIHVKRVDRRARVMETLEASGTIRRWDHTLTVRPDRNGCTWTDCILIDAGWTTAITARVAKRLYRTRHRSRNALSIASELVGA